jgi:hypothetical protein
MNTEIKKIALAGAIALLAGGANTEPLAGPKSVSGSTPPTKDVR